MSWEGVKGVLSSQLHSSESLLSEVLSLVLYSELLLELSKCLFELLDLLFLPLNRSLFFFGRCLTKVPAEWLFLNFFHRPCKSGKHFFGEFFFLSKFILAGFPRVCDHCRCVGCPESSISLRRQYIARITHGFYSQVISSPPPIAFIKKYQL
uniref:Putative ORF2 n=1 Tax=Torque teno calomys tener virus TaxID=2054616 RepID=A0A2H4QBC7_9VIRU|nr:putative ORF2 [Torque teno calomys tener virus]